MRPREWANTAKSLFGPPVREHITSYGCDLDYQLYADDEASLYNMLLDNLQDTLDLLPEPGSMRLTLIGRVTSAPEGSKRWKTEVELNAGTDETIDNGLVQRATLPTSTAIGSKLLGRVFGEGGGYERLAAAYGEKNIAKYVLIEFRYPPEKPCKA